MDGEETPGENEVSRGSGKFALGVVSLMLGSILLGGYLGGWFNSKKDYSSLKYSEVCSTQPTTQREKEGLELRIPVTQPDERGR